MDLSIDTDSTTERRKCPNCRAPYLYMQRFVLDRGAAFAAVFVEGHRHHHGHREHDHDDLPELYITAILGSWDDDSDSDKTTDHATFACRYGYLDSEKDFAFSLLDVPEDFDSPEAGRKLTRTQALKHERINEYWHVMDFLMETDQDIHEFLFHPMKSKLKNTFRR